MKVYDSAWIMHNNRPVEKKVFAVIESMDYDKTGTEISYLIVDSVIGTGFGNNEGTRYTADRVFATKEALLESL